MSPSFQARRAITEDDSTLWSVADCLREVLRQVEAGEMDPRSCLLMFVYDKDGDRRLDNWRANLGRDEEAFVLTSRLHALTCRCGE